jgi:PAS domain S-box-containing protein
MQTAQLRPKPASFSPTPAKQDQDPEALPGHATDEPVILDDSSHPAKGWNSDEGVIWADSQGYITYANPASERFLGLTPEELKGLFGFDLCEPHSLPDAREAFGRCLAHPETPVDATVDIVRPSVGFRRLAVTLINRLAVPDIKAIVVHFRDAKPPVLHEG